MWSVNRVTERIMKRKFVVKQCAEIRYENTYCLDCITDIHVHVSIPMGSKVNSAKYVSIEKYAPLF